MADDQPQQMATVTQTDGGIQVTLADGTVLTGDDAEAFIVKAAEERAAELRRRFKRASAQTALKAETAKSLIGVNNYEMWREMSRISFIVEKLFPKGSPQRAEFDVEFEEVMVAQLDALINHQTGSKLYVPTGRVKK